MTSIVAFWSSACSVARGVEEPVAAERVRHEVGRHDAVALLHHEERRAEDAGVALEPVHARDGHRGVQRDLSHDLELAFEVVLAEDRHVDRVGRDAGDERLRALGALFVEHGVEEQRLRGHPVGGGNVELGDAYARGVRASRGEPGLQRTAGVFEVAGERLWAFSDLGRPVDRVLVWHHVPLERTPTLPRADFRGRARVTGGSRAGRPSGRARPPARS